MWRNIAGTVDCEQCARMRPCCPMCSSRSATATRAATRPAGIKRAIADHNLIGSSSHRARRACTSRRFAAACAGRTQPVPTRHGQYPRALLVGAPGRSGWGPQKAMDTVTMAVARARHLAPQREMEVPVSHAALVIGGGIAGIQAALDLADAGHQVYLVEKQPSIGGKMGPARQNVSDDGL